MDTNCCIQIMDPTKPNCHMSLLVQCFHHNNLVFLSLSLCITDFGGFMSPYVKGYIQPPTKLAPHFVGRKKGIQGDQNSCYLDTTLYSMYAYSNIFDAILKRTKEKGDLKEFEGVQTTLREHIVNPLRR